MMLRKISSMLSFNQHRECGSAQLIAKVYCVSVSVGMDLWVLLSACSHLELTWMTWNEYFMENI